MKSYLRSKEELVKMSIDNLSNVFLEKKLNLTTEEKENF